MGSSTGTSRPAGFHGVAQASLDVGAAQVGERLPHHMADKTLAGRSDHRLGGAVQVDDAVLPVDGEHALADVFEDGAHAGGPGIGVGRRQRLERHAARQQLVVPARLAQDVAAHHVQLGAAGTADRDVVHEPVDEKQPPAADGDGIGWPRGVDGSRVEARAGVVHDAVQIVAVEPERELEIVARVAVTDGVGRGLFDAQHDLFDRLVVGDVEAQIVAHPFAGPGQPGGIERDTEVEPRDGPAPRGSDRPMPRRVCFLSLPCRADYSRSLAREARRQLEWHLTRHRPGASARTNRHRTDRTGEGLGPCRSRCAGAVLSSS